MKFNFVSFENAKELVLRIKALIATHTGNSTIHTTSAEKTKWNAVTNKVDKVTGKGLSTNDYTTNEKNKLAGISLGAEVNVQSDWSVNDTGSDSFIKNKPTAMPASDVPAWAKASSKPSYGWGEITGKPATFSPAAHNHSSLVTIDITGKTVDLNSYNLSSGSPSIQWYIEKTNGGAANITNIPISGQPFTLKAELIRWTSTNDYITKHTFTSSSTKSVYERFCTNGTWTAWLPQGRFTVTPISGRVIISDGITGGIKSSDYSIASSVPSGAKFTDTDTKNTAGATNTSSKIFLVGATSQATNPVTYSHDTAYVGTDGCVYSNSKKTSVEGHTHPYAGSSSSGGVANSANKLNTARKIGNASFDGTANITLSQIGAADVNQVNQLQETVNHITASHSIDGGDLMDSGQAENIYDGGTL